MHGIQMFSCCHSCNVRTLLSYAPDYNVCEPDVHYKQHKQRYTICVNSYAVIPTFSVFLYANNSILK